MGINGFVTLQDFSHQIRPTTPVVDETQRPDILDHPATPLRDPRREAADIPIVGDTSMLSRNVSDTLIVRATPVIETAVSLHHPTRSTNASGGAAMDISCPQCQRVDLVQSIPALHADGVSTSYSTHHYSGVGIASSGFVPVFGTTTTERLHASQLARTLAREPYVPPPTRPVMIGLLGTILILAAVPPFIFIVQEPGPILTRIVAVMFALMLLAIAASPTAIAFTIAVKRSRRSSEIASGRRDAHTVWSAGYYCHRCGVTFWPAAPTPWIQPRRAFTPHDFRWLVWNAGRFHRPHLGGRR
ncbi:hypothetical protein [Nocardia sp. NPDC052566]|uniref:hypothetical protein n=1 Tax=Nocardia sp. NPDC052566 TaxID=3364330 RepID=UPI0037CC451D